jgi:hypothetical protein
VAHRDRGRGGRAARGEDGGGQRAVLGRHEEHADPAVDPRKRDGRELRLDGEDRPLFAEQVHDQVDPGRRVGDERDLVGVGAHETGHADPDALDPLQPLLPGPVALLFELAIVGVDGGADGARCRAARGRVEVDPPGEDGEITPDLAPRSGHRPGFYRRADLPWRNARATSAGAFAIGMGRGPAVDRVGHERLRDRARDGDPTGNGERLAPRTKQA